MTPERKSEVRIHAEDPALCNEDTAGVIFELLDDISAADSMVIDAQTEAEMERAYRKEGEAYRDLLRNKIARIRALVAEVTTALDGGP